MYREVKTNPKICTEKRINKTAIIFTMRKVSLGFRLIFIGMEIIKKTDLYIIRYANFFKDEKCLYLMRR